MNLEKLTDIIDAVVEGIGIIVLAAFASVAGVIAVRWAFGIIAKLLAD